MTVQSKRKVQDIIEDMIYELEKHKQIIDNLGLPNITKFKKLTKELTQVTK